jgi:hypothetical protein
MFSDESMNASNYFLIDFPDLCPPRMVKGPMHKVESSSCQWYSDGENGDWQTQPVT